MSPLPTTSQTWIVASKPAKEIVDTNDVFQRKEQALPELKDGEILVAVRYLCVQAVFGGRGGEEGDTVACLLLAPPQARPS